MNIFKKIAVGAGALVLGVTLAACGTAVESKEMSGAESGASSVDQGQGAATPEEAVAMYYENGAKFSEEDYMTFMGLIEESGLENADPTLEPLDSIAELTPEGREILATGMSELNTNKDLIDYRGLSKDEVIFVDIISIGDSGAFADGQGGAVNAIIPEDAITVTGDRAVVDLVQVTAESEYDEEGYEVFPEGNKLGLVKVDNAWFIDGKSLIEEWNNAASEEVQFDEDGFMVDEDGNIMGDTLDDEVIMDGEPIIIEEN